MRFILTVLLCLFCCLSVLAQTENYKESEKKITVEKITLAREDSDGNIEENISVFKPSDFPIYCYVDLNEAESVDVKMILVAEKVIGKRENSKIIVVSYKTKENENNVQFRASPEKLWAVGDYRIDIFLDGKLANSKKFKVNADAK